MEILRDNFSVSLLYEEDKDVNNLYHHMRGAY